MIALGKISLKSPVLAGVALTLLILTLIAQQFIKRKKIFKMASLPYSKTKQIRALLEPQGNDGKNLSSARVLGLMRFLGLLLLALALARPQKITVQELEPVLGVDIALVIDTSSSMQALDFHPLDRLEAAKKIAGEFIKKRKSDRIGLVAFGGAGVLTCPPTLDHEALLSFLKHIQIGMTKSDGTAIGSGVMTALTHLRKIPSKSKIVILLTDGRSNAGAVDPMTAAKAAEAIGVKIYAVGAGKRGGGIFAVQDPLLGTRYVRATEEEIDEETLTKMAQLSGGRYYRATDLNELSAIFDEIDALEKTSIDPPKHIEYKELYPPLLVGALFLLGLETLLRATLLLTLP